MVDKIYVVCIKGICEEHGRVEQWIDSYWTDRDAAIAIAEKIWEGDRWELLTEITVFGRALNKTKCGQNAWDETDEFVKRFKA